MSGEHRKGLIYSAALHFVMLMLGIFGLPSFLQRQIPPQPMVIAVDILPISEKTNVKTSDAPLSEIEKEVPPEEAKKSTPPTKSEPPPPPEPKPPEPKKEEKPTPKPEEKPEIKPSEKKPEPKPAEKKPEKKPEPKKPEKAKEKDLEAVLKSLREEDAKKEKTEDKKQDKPTEEAGTRAKSKNATYDPGQPMSMSELDAIRSQIAKYWNVPAGAKDAHNLQVVLRVNLQQDGTVTYVGLADSSRARYAADSFYRAAADSAMRAVRQASPLQNLPQDKYQTWKDMDVTFDPKEMLF